MERRETGTANEYMRANVRALMRQHQMSQVRLAALLGVSQPRVCVQISGKSPFTLKDLDTLSAVFGVSPAVLVSAADAPETTAGNRNRTANLDEAMPLLR